MLAQELMTKNPASCRPEDTIQDAARKMAENDCGMIPVCNDDQPVGTITDRDIACRAVAQGKDPRSTRVSEIMSRDPVTVSADDDIELCAELLEREQLRRIVVVDASGHCAGVISQADLARLAPAEVTAEVVRKVSLPAHAGAR